MGSFRKLLAVSVIVIVVVSAIVAVYLTRSQVAPSISLAPSTLIAVQGANVTFNVYGLESNGVATVFFGDGQEANTTSTVIHDYQESGRYLVGAEEFVGDLPVASTFNALRTIQVTPQVNQSFAPLISLPAIAFDVTENPKAPVVQVSDQLSLYGGFLQPPSGSNITIAQYEWDFGNGDSKTLAANSTSFKPVENPVAASYSQSGLYPVTLTLVTENSTNMATYRTQVEQTIAVASTSQPYAIFLYAGIVPNPSVINVAEPGAGGPFSFDPQIDNEVIGGEVVQNICSTLLIYNGSSTTQFIPFAATQVPTVANGEISPDYATYTFQIRSSMRFSNGDPLTAYDVWYSMVRSLLFTGGNTGTGGWILAQYLIPGAATGAPIMTAVNDSADFNAIMNSMSYSNSSNTMTFRLVKPTASQLFFAAIALVWVAGISDSAWLNEIGAGITFTPAGFYAYQNQGNFGSFNSKAQWDPVASGPYMIQTYVPGQSITLIANPGFPGVPGIPAVNNTVVIQWVKDIETEYNLFTSGQADLVRGGQPFGLPSEYMALILKQVANGKAVIYQSPSLSESVFKINVDVDVAAMKADFGPQYHVPSDYFANLDVREAFTYAFNYTNYLDEIIGDKKYGIDFGSSYAGVIIPGLPYYVPPSELQNVPTYNLTKAKQLLQQSGQYNTSIYIPVTIFNGASDQVPAAEMWAAALNSIDPNIAINVVPISQPTYSSYFIPNQNPIPISFGGWTADYPYPSDFVDGMYLQGGIDPGANGWTVEYLNSTGHADQAAMYAKMNSLIQVADSTTNATLAAQDYKQIEQIAINLYMYVYLFTPNQFWVVKPYMNGYQGQISYENNPVFWPDGLYFWWVKTCGSTEACSARGVGP